MQLNHSFTGETLKSVRRGMGLSVPQLADWLYMHGAWSERTIRRWEEGKIPVPGPVIKALELAGEIDIVA